MDNYPERPSGADLDRRLNIEIAFDNLLARLVRRELRRLPQRFDNVAFRVVKGKLRPDAYPLVTLKEARSAAREAKKQWLEGKDPAALKRERKRARAAELITFRVLSEEYVEKQKREGRAASTLSKLEWLLSLAYPDIGDMPIKTIKAPDALVPLQRIEKSGRLESARRLRSTIGSVFRYAIATGRAEHDPTFALQRALATPKPKPRAAIIEPDALAGLLRSINGYKGQRTTNIALLLMAHLFPRPGELRQATWSEFDLERCIWSIPEERTKMRRPHRTPLSPQAIDLLLRLQPYTGYGKLVFPSVRSAKRPISDNAMTSALRNMGYTKDEIVPHGFRATASTLLNESGKWHPDAIERQLAHVEKNEVRRAYARGEHWAERMKMMNWWSSFLEGLMAKNDCAQTR